CVNRKLPENERADKRFEYFLLTRDPEVVEGEAQAVTGQDLSYAKRDTDPETFSPAVAFVLNGRGAQRFAELTAKNAPSKGGFRRHLAIVLDGEIVSAPGLKSSIPGG